MFRMKTLIVMAVIIAALVACGAAYGQGGTNFFLTGRTDGWSGSFATTALGYEFTAAKTTWIVAVGRLKGSGGINQDHLVNIWAVSGQTLLGGAIVNGSSAVDSKGFAYTALSTAIQLVQGQTYRIASDEYIGGDKWLDGQYGGQLGTDSTVATMGFPTMGNTDDLGLYPSVLMNWVPQGWAFVPPTFYTTDTSPVTPEPSSLVALAMGAVTAGGFVIRRKRS